MNFNNSPKSSIVSIGQINFSGPESSASPVDENDLPILPTRNLVLFPGVTLPISLGRENSLRTAKLSEENHIPIGVLCQSKPDIESPAIPDDFFQYGVVADVIKVIDLPDGSHTAIVHARGSFELLGDGLHTHPETGISAAIKPIKEINPRTGDKEFEVLVTEIKNLMLGILDSTNDAPEDFVFNIKHTEDPDLLINLIATHLPIEPTRKIKLLAQKRLKSRAFLLLTELSISKQLAQITQSIQQRTHSSLTEQQRSNFLQHQLESIKRELYGDIDETDKMLERGRKVPFPDEAYKVFVKEVEKLSRLNPQSPDYAVQYSYLETLLAMPWLKYDPENDNLSHAREILDNDHYGLEKVKERILEQLAVIMNNPEGKAPILCFVGAPGVGKTSLGESIARAMNRKYQRVSLGGLHDEAELRGHRRTYIGAMPGRIIESVKRGGSSNPVLLLDEIDKMSKDYKGDPSAALLEILDPEQNCHFHDNFIDIDYDLSKVLFIATANSLNGISQPLLDRLEIIDLSGYLPEEKIEIAKRHLIPKILKENKLEPQDITVSDEALTYIIDNYTSEGGVRQLEKKITAIIRKTILRKVSGDQYEKSITPSVVREYLGVPIYSRDSYEGNNFAGVVTGLAWTANGGEILYIETSLSKGNGEKLTLTGNLGDVMKESAFIALEYVRSHAANIGIDPALFEKYNVHIHVPEGAVPKDGPSAGITIATSIVSAFLQRKVKKNIAMTGEITLRGKVMPVGGIKEKMLAAKRAGIKEIILSQENEKNVEDIPSKYREGLVFNYVNTVDEVLNLAMTDEKVDNALVL